MPPRLSASTKGQSELVSHATPMLVNVIVTVFAEVFELSEIDADADFFDLGGDSLAAATLMLGLERFGVQLPVAALIGAPTPAGLAELVASGTAGRVLPLVTLKQGDATTPVFLLPGAGGSVLQMVRFARLVVTPRAIYGLQSLDTRGAGLSFSSIEELAASYLRVVRNAQPQGPYTLAGYSMGGAVALELAQLLKACGQTVARVVMIDTPTPLTHFSPVAKLRFWKKRLAFHMRRARQMRPMQARNYLLRRLGGLARDFGMEGAESRERMNRNRTTEALAFLAYRPSRFDGSIAFILAESTDEGLGCYPEILWQRLAHEFRCARIAGDHWSMLSNSAEALAREFAAALP